MVMLESGIASYTTNATYAYRRTPFVGQQVTSGNGVIRAPSPPPAATSMGGSGTGGLVGQSGKSDAVIALSPPPAASSAGRGDVSVLRGHPGRVGGIWGGITLPSLSPVAPSTKGDTGGLRGQSDEWRQSDRLDIPAQQDNPRSQSRRHTVTPAVTRSAARTQLGVGDQSGAFTVYPRRRVSVRQLPPRPRPIPTALSFLHARPAVWRRRPRTRRRTRDLIARFGGRRRTRSSTVCARLAHSRSWGAHSNEGSTLSRPSGYILERVTSLAM